MEDVQRAKSLLKMVLDGNIPSNDFGRYQLHMQSCVYQTKAIMNRVDTKSMYERMENSGLDVSGRLLVNGQCPMVPPEIQQFLQNAECFKVEWMDHGRYHCKASECYGSNFMTLDTIMWISDKFKISPKIVDYSGFNAYDIPIRMWIESLFMQGAAITYTGPCYWRKEDILAQSTIKIMSFLVNHSAIITATKISKGKKYTI